MKDLIIKPEEGYEIDKDKSTFERIVFKKKDGRVRSWEYLHFSQRNLPSKDVFLIKALTKLLIIRQQWINDYDPNWKPVWDGNTKNWCINRAESDICVYGFYSQYYELSFPTKEMAEDFLDTFEELLSVYFKV